MSKTDAYTKCLVMQAAKAAGDQALASNGGRVPPYPGLAYRVPSSIKLSDLGSSHQDLPALHQAQGGSIAASYCSGHRTSKHPFVHWLFAGQFQWSGSHTHQPNSTSGSVCGFQHGCANPHPTDHTKLSWRCRSQLTWRLCCKQQHGI